MILLVALLAVCGGVAEPQVRAVEGPVRSLALTNVTLIDGTGAEPQPNRVVVIEGERIVAVHAADEYEPAASVQIRDLEGHFIIPGLIDSHVHLTSGLRTKKMRAAQLDRALRGGVTTVRDMGGNAAILAELAKSANEPSHASPRIYFSALFAGPEFLQRDPRVRIATGNRPIDEVPWIHAVTSELDVEAALDAAESCGATGIKIYAEIDAEMIAKLTRAAHRRGLRTWSHTAVFPVRPSDVVRSGVQVVSHSSDFVFEDEDEMPTGYHAARETKPTRSGHDSVHSDQLTALFEAMVEHETILDATVYLSRVLVRRRMRGLVPGDPRISGAIPYARRAHELGVEIAAGTDMLFDRPQFDLPCLHLELEELVAGCGLTPLEAIRAATLVGARVVGEDERLGTVEVGKLADLVVLTKDPTESILNTRSISFVMKSGMIFRPLNEDR